VISLIARFGWLVVGTDVAMVISINNEVITVVIVR